MSAAPRPPLILGLVSDLFFAVPIEQAARTLGYAVQWADRDETLLAARGLEFVRRVVDWQPAAVLVELGGDRLPWREGVAALKTSPATRRIPVIAFGPHVDLALRAEAQAVGCDVILAKSALLRDLPGLLQKQVRRVDTTALDADCAAPLSAEAVAGIALFDRGEFFEAHEALEYAWNADPGPARELYRGLLQVAVAYLQIERGNFDGALKMFLRLRQWLEPLPDECRGVDVARLRAEAQAAQAELEALGPQRLNEFDRALFRPVPMVAAR